MALQRPLCTGIAGAVLAWSGCHAEAPGPPPPLVLLVSIDTLRADRLGLYGSERSVSPNLDALARESVIFESAQTTAPWTLPAHASLLSGRYPSRHGLVAHGGRLRKGISTLASILSDEGWATASVVNSRHLSERNGLQQGFARRFLRRETARQVRATLPLVDQALEWIDEERERPLFLFLHTFDVHSNYRSTPPHRGRFENTYTGPVAGYTSQLLAHRQGAFSLDPEGLAHLRDLYDQSVHQVDAELGRLFDELRRRGRLDSALVIVTSDHGEEFLDHGDVLHGRNHYEAAVRIPLLIRHPDLPTGLRIETPVSLVDIVPTVLAQLELTGPGLGEFDGRDLAPLWEAPDSSFPSRGLFIEGDHNREPPGMLVSIRRDDFKLHLDRSAGTSRLFDLASDPTEAREVSAAHPAVAQSLRQELNQFLRDAPQAVEIISLPEEKRAQLKRLGYLVPNSSPEKNQVLSNQHHQAP